jgi:hypothetical protein
VALGPLTFSRAVLIERATASLEVALELRALPAHRRGMSKRVLALRERARGHPFGCRLAIVWGRRSADATDATSAGVWSLIRPTHRSAAGRPSEGNVVYPRAGRT